MAGIEDQEKGEDVGGCGEGGEIGGGGAGDDEDDEYERLADDLSRLGERIGDGFRRECGEEDGE